MMWIWIFLILWVGVALDIALDLRRLRRVKRRVLVAERSMGRAHVQVAMESGAAFAGRTARLTKAALADLAVARGVDQRRAEVMTRGQLAELNELVSAGDVGYMIMGGGPTNDTCWWCGAAAAEREYIQTMESTHKITMVTRWEDKAGQDGHLHQVTPPSPANLLDEGLALARKIQEWWRD